MTRPFLHLAAVMAAFLALAAPASAATADRRLDELFIQLQRAADDAVAEAVEEQIWESWLDHPDRDVLKLMLAGVQTLHKEEFKEAVVIFDVVVEMAPEYAEGWNKRANAHYLAGNYAAAVADIQRTLALEPRHFAALAGLGLIYIALDEPTNALKAFDAALRLNPHLTGVREEASKLRRQLAGTPL